MPGNNDTNVNQSSATISQDDSPRGVEDRPEAPSLGDNNMPPEVPNEDQTPVEIPEKA